MSKTKSMIWKRLNFTSGNRVKKTPGINQLKSSLEHSLRIVQKNDLEFNKDLIEKNIVFFNNKLTRMDKLSIDDRKEIFISIYAPLTEQKQNNGQLSEVNCELSKYAYKLKALIKKNEDSELTSFLQALLHNPEAVDIDSSNVIDKMNIQRKKQKISCVNNYIELKNKSVELNKSDDDFSLKKTVIQEAFWKFPFNQCVDNVKPTDYMNIINNFYKEHLPDYPVKLIVFHGDEITNRHDENLGVHPHIFIDGKNKKTGKYDLINDEFKMVNDFLKSEGNPEIEGRKFSDAQTLGEAYQRMIYAFVNKELVKKGYDFQVDVLPETEDKKIRRKLINADASKPKMFRTFNSINKSMDELAALEITLKEKAENQAKLDKDLKRVLGLSQIYKQENEKLSGDNKKLYSRIDDGKQEAIVIDSNIKAMRKTENDLATSINSKTDEIKELDILIEDKRTYYEKLSDAFKSVRNFVEACIHRSIRYETTKPNQSQLDNVNNELKIMHKELPSPEGQKLINEYLDIQEAELHKNDIPVKFEGGFLDRKSNRLAKIRT
ncbi:hypothetical protein [Pseudomonas fildesensis]|uniref:Uncharacterized protein n=1 Tax=Pseudomonas fildesensis TaxID=1674920 RepID=A0A0J8FZN7_9PSED|nr:hypothetical protein [Pseudomonas fildesensis]KMT55767.1 hypothetical protein ACR52_10400 [Pseudomonas fildesensis]